MIGAVTAGGAAAVRGTAVGDDFRDVVVGAPKFGCGALREIEGNERGIAAEGHGLERGGS